MKCLQKSSFDCSSWGAAVQEACWVDICPQHKQGAAYPVVPMGKKAPQVFAFRFPLAAWWPHAYFFCSFPILEWFLSAVLMGNSSAFALF